MKGRIHSVESCGTVDGPGLRFVIFMQGCPLRCLYCHNPDTWHGSEGQQREVGELVTEVLKYRSYMRFSGGGVTISGGEPLTQPDFVLALIQQLKAEGLHVAVDTSGVIFTEKTCEVLKAADLVLLDIKTLDADLHRELTGLPLDLPVKTANWLAEMGIPVWLRHVLVPGLTLETQRMAAVATFAASLPNVERVELLPFHQLGAFKWQELGLKYQLAETPEPTKIQLAEAEAIFQAAGVNISL